MKNKLNNNYHLEYYYNNKEKIDSRTKKWKENNPEATANHYKKYRTENADIISQRMKEKRKNNPGKYAKYSKQYRESNIRRFLSKKKSNSKVGKRKNGRIIEFDLPLDFLVNLYTEQNGKCAISGYKMTIRFKDMYSVSIDRINSEKGYTPDNVQLICQVMNFAKNSYDNNKFIDFLKNMPNFIE